MGKMSNMEKSKISYIERLAAHLLKQSKKSRKRSRNTNPNVGVIEKEQVRKAISAIKSMGCFACGYSTCDAALEFHHRDKTEKSFAVGTGGNKSWDAVMQELAKCTLLCANCHREVHAGILSV